MSFLDDWDAPVENDGARYYQLEGVEATETAWLTEKSVLNVLATGLGKSYMMALLAKRADGPCLWLAHRDELVVQAVGHLERMTGEYVEIEQGQLRCSSKTRLVVASLSTISRQSRLERLGRDRFHRVFFDEAHHAPAATYRKPLEYFNAKQVGFTATADRADEKALGQLFDVVAYCMDIEEGIESGHLVPIRGLMVELKEIDLTSVKASAGDLAAGQLDEVMLKAVEGIVRETLRLSEGRAGIVFFPGVKTAEYACQKFNQLEPNSACFIHAGTDPDERKQIVKDFKAGRYRILCNVDIATEGFDAPHIGFVGMGRPTKSRAKHAQMIGRGTRTAPGCIDYCDGKELAEYRRQRIAESEKPDLLVLDFVGNSGKHTLVSPVDLLGGNYSEDEVALAKKKYEAKEGGDPRAALAAARAELAELARLTRARVTSEVRKFDPFSTLHLNTKEVERYNVRFGQQPITPSQASYLERRFDLEPHEISGLSKKAASDLITALKIRESKGLARPRQLYNLQRFGVTDVNLSRARAAKGMEYLIACNYGKRMPVSPEILHRLLYERT